MGPALRSQWEAMRKTPDIIKKITHCVHDSASLYPLGLRSNLAGHIVFPFCFKKGNGVAKSRPQKKTMDSKYEQKAPVDTSHLLRLIQSRIAKALKLSEASLF